jgi:hypothetical protein
MPIPVIQNSSAPFMCCCPSGRKCFGLQQPRWCAHLRSTAAGRLVVICLHLWFLVAFVGHVFVSSLLVLLFSLTISCRIFWFSLNCFFNSSQISSCKLYPATPCVVCFTALQLCILGFCGLFDHKHFRVWNGKRERDRTVAVFLSLSLYLGKERNLQRERERKR